MNDLGRILASATCGRIHDREVVAVCVVIQLTSNVWNNKLITLFSPLYQAAA